MSTTISGVEQIQSAILAHLSRLRKCTPPPSDPNQPFLAMGIDSLDAICLVGELEDRLGFAIDPATLFDHPTPHALARHLAERISHAC